MNFTSKKSDAEVVTTELLEAADPQDELISLLKIGMLKKMTHPDFYILHQVGTEPLHPPS